MEKESKSSLILIIILIVIVLCLIATLVYMIFNNNRNVEETKSNKTTTGTSNYSEKDLTIQELEKNLKEKDDSIKKLEKDIFVLEGDIAKLKETKTIDYKNISSAEGEDEYELVKRLALDALKDSVIYFGDDTSNYATAKEVYINKIEICNEEYLETMVNNNVQGNYYFQYGDIKEYPSRIYGGITYTLVFDRDVTDGWLSGYGPAYAYKNYAIQGTGFMVEKVDGEYKIGFGNG